MCAVCLDSASGPTKRVSLGFDVRVWLCGQHAGESFQVRNRGRDFVGALVRVWLASGGLRRQHHCVIRALLERAQRSAVDEEAAHISYNWPTLRTEMEDRLGDGEELEEIVADFERRHGRDVARLPSMRTYRRWRAESRKAVR